MADLRGALSKLTTEDTGSDDTGGEGKHRGEGDTSGAEGGTTGSGEQQEERPDFRAAFATFLAPDDSQGDDD